jgi:hypothetical protein
MISVPGGIQTQLGEAVSVIADSDFWERWDTLVAVRCKSVLRGDVMINLELGFGVTIRSQEPGCQQWSPHSGALHFPAVASSIPIRRSVHRDQSCTQHFLDAIFSIVRGTTNLLFRL